MSIELLKEFEKRALEVGMKKEKFDKVSTHILQTAIDRVNQIPGYYKALRRNAKDYGIEFGLNDEDAEDVANSFVDFDRIQEVMEESMAEVVVEGRSHAWVMCWFDDRARSYAKNYALGKYGNAEETAKNLLSDKYFCNSVIARLTGLSYEKIEYLSKEMSKKR